MVVTRKRFGNFKKAVAEVQRILRIQIAKEIIRERDDLHYKEARAKAAAIRLAETKARLERERIERLERERLEKERLERERLERERLEKERRESERIATEQQEKDKLEEEKSKLEKENAHKQEELDEEERRREAELQEALDSLEKEVLESEAILLQANAEAAEAVKEAAAQEQDDAAKDQLAQKPLVRSTSLARMNSKENLNILVKADSDYTFTKYAKSHFPEDVSSTFSRTPLKQPLLDLTDATRHEALIISQMIMAFMGDYTFKHTFDVNHGVRLICEKGIHQPILRDEIYCQIMRQCSENPSQCVSLPLPPLTAHYAQYCTCIFPGRARTGDFCSYSSA